MCFTVQLSRSLSCDSHIRLSHLFWLVKNFFLFLGNFFFQEFQKFLRAPLSPTAMLEYHSISSLSTNFSNLLNIIYFIYNLEYSVNSFIASLLIPFFFTKRSKVQSFPIMLSQIKRPAETDFSYSIVSAGYILRTYLLTIVSVMLGTSFVISHSSCALSSQVVII